LPFGKGLLERDSHESGHGRSGKELEISSFSRGPSPADRCLGQSNANKEPLYYAWSLHFLAERQQGGCRRSSVSSSPTRQHGGTGRKADPKCMLYGAVECMVTHTSKAPTS